MVSTRIALAAWLLNTVVLLYLVMNALRIQEVYQGLGIEHPSLLTNWMIMPLLISSIFSFGFWYLAQMKHKQGKDVLYARIISLALLTIPLAVIVWYLHSNVLILR